MSGSSCCQGRIQWLILFGFLQPPIVFLVPGSNNRLAPATTGIWAVNYPCKLSLSVSLNHAVSMCLSNKYIYKYQNINICSKRGTKFLAENINQIQMNQYYSSLTSFSIHSYKLFNPQKWHISYENKFLFKQVQIKNACICAIICYICYI